METTTITIGLDTWRKLVDLKLMPGETFDEIINKILNKLEVKK